MLNFLPPDKAIQSIPNTRKKTLKAFIIFLYYWTHNFLFR